MAEVTLRLLEKTRFDFGSLVSSSVQVLTLLERIDISQFMWGTLELRVHASDLTGGSISFELVGDGATEEEPGAVFTTASTLIPSVGVQAAPAFVSTAGVMAGEHAMLRVRATKSSGGALNATVSASLVLREEPFDPTEFPGCVLWLDMLEGPSYSVVPGTTPTLSSIRNLVSGVAWTESTNPPLFEPTGLNGRPCMKGDGTARRLISGEPALANAFKGVNQLQTVILVTLPSAASVYVASFGAGNSGVTDNGTVYVGRRTSDGRFRLERTDDAGLNTAADRSVVPALVPQVVTYTSYGATMAIHVNNEAVPDPNGTNISSGGITPNQCGVFCRPDNVPDLFSNDRIGAVLVFSAALTNSNRQSVVNWLMSRWGIS